MQFRVVTRVVKKRQFMVVIRVVERGILGWLVGLLKIGSFDGYYGG